MTTTFPYTLLGHMDIIEGVHCLGPLYEPEQRAAANSSSCFGDLNQFMYFTDSHFF